MELGMMEKANLQPGTPSQELARIEARIEYNLTSAYSNIVDIGRCLNEAKEKKLVPHGQWEAWLSEKTGMSAEQAQRWMRIAREVPEGSYLSRLEVSKIREILTLPEPQREEVAREAAENDTSVRELKAQIKDIKEQLRAARRRRAVVDADLNNARDYVDQQREKIETLTRQLDEAQRATPEKGISAEAAKEIERLKRELQDAEAFGNLQSEKRREAQMELLRIKNKGAEAKAAMDSRRLTEAVYAFLREAGQVPQMGKDFSLMAESERRGWEIGVGMIANWLRGAETALNMVTGEVAQ